MSRAPTEGPINAYLINTGSQLILIRRRCAWTLQELNAQTAATFAVTIGYLANMDLTKQVPRSPNDMLAGIVSLPRMIDKTQANAEGTLGEYDVDCPHDRPVLDFLGVDFSTFAAKLKELGYDTGKVEAWAKSLVDKHSPAEISAFNESRRNWKPDGHSQGYFDSMKAEVAPNRSDVTTWFQILDLDEKRAA